MKTIALDLSKPDDFEVDGRKFSLGKKVASGDIADFYECNAHKPAAHKPNGNRFDHILEGDEDFTQAWLKVPRNSLDTDLSENEAANLLKLFPSKAEDQKSFRFFPRILAAFKLKNSEVQAIVIPYMEGYFNLDEVHRVHPALNFRDVVWMFKRTLAALWFTHHNGFIHGAIIPPHIMVHPIEHGAKIMDWSYSVEVSSGAKIRVMSRAYEAFYAPEILAKEDSKPSTDIYMAAKCALYLLGGDVKTNKFPSEVPAPIQEFFLECLDPDRYMRPQDAGDLHERFDQLLLGLVGEPSYRKLEMPERTAP